MRQDCDCEKKLDLRGITEYLIFQVANSELPAPLAAVLHLCASYTCNYALANTSPYDIACIDFVRLHDEIN